MIFGADWCRSNPGKPPCHPQTTLNNYRFPLLLSLLPRAYKKKYSGVVPLPRRQGTPTYSSQQLLLLFFFAFSWCEDGDGGPGKRGVGISGVRQPFHQEFLSSLHLGRHKIALQNITVTEGVRQLNPLAVGVIKESIKANRWAPDANPRVFVPSGLPGEGGGLCTCLTEIIA